MIPVPGFERYSIEPDGDSWIVRGPAGVMRGYIQHGRVYLNLNQCTIQLGRVVLLTLVGPPPEGKPWACHRNGNPMDNRRKNLYWGSAQDNADDAKRHGVHIANTPRGERHYNYSIPQSTINAIRAEYVPRPPGGPLGVRRGMGLQPGSQRWLAAKYGLTQPQIKQIVKNRTRKAAVA